MGTQNVLKLTKYILEFVQLPFKYLLPLEKVYKYWLIFCVSQEKWCLQSDYQSFSN